MNCLLEMKTSFSGMSGRSPRLADAEDSPQCNIQSVESRLYPLSIANQAGHVWQKYVRISAVSHANPKVE